MEYEKITNPLTGRKVSVNGIIGRKVINNYIRVLNGGGSNCTKYHDDPIKCQASKDASGKYCVYSAAKYKGEVGQCRKSTARDIEKAKESARRRKQLSEKFQTHAAKRVQRRYRSKKRIDRFADTAKDLVAIERVMRFPRENRETAEETRENRVNCSSLRKGKCRENKGCMLTKGKKKKCVPCNYNKYNTSDACIYR